TSGGRSKAMELGDAKERHYQLYTEMMTMISDGCADSDEVKQRIQEEVIPFLENLSGIAADAEAIPDYIWVRNARQEWQSIFSRMGLRTDIELAEPSSELQPAPLPKRFMSEAEIRRAINRIAYNISCYRRARRETEFRYSFSRPEFAQQVLREPQII